MKPHAIQILSLSGLLARRSFGGTGQSSGFWIPRARDCVAIMCVSCLFMEDAQKIRHSLA